MHSFQLVVSVSQQQLNVLKHVHLQSFFFFPSSSSYNILSVASIMPLSWIPRELERTLLSSSS